MKKLGFGLMRLPKLDAMNDNSPIDLETVRQMVDLFMQKGFSYYDTAYIYGDGASEEAFREAVVRRYPREAFTITDKLPMMNFTAEDQLEPAMQTMLTRCGVDYFDYLWLHAITGPNWEKAQKFHAFEYLVKQKEIGRAKHIGFSFHGSPELLEEVLTAHPEAEYVQLQLNYLDWEDPTVQSRRCYEVCVKHNRQVIVMEPVKGGSLANIPEDAQKLFRAHDAAMSNASWAVRFAASQENVMVVLSGMSTLAQVQDNTSYMETFQPLSDEEKKMVGAAADIIRKNIAIPCTACRYCTSVCPKKIAIPDYFAIYNTMKRFGDSAYGDVINYYNNLVVSHGRPSDCIRCGRCEARCPQHLTIRKYLVDVGKELESE